ncbi:retrovirus-related pol polyprotein from transposon TNT 1-94, partial [Tanacetum coccineum]
MDSIISLGQKNTLAEYMILSGADNRPPMLDKDLYDSWKSRMELYMQNREHERMILESVEHGPLIWPTVEENGVIRTKKYAELSAAEKIQADCDMKATQYFFKQDDTTINFNTISIVYNNLNFINSISTPSQHGTIQPNQHYSSHYPSQTQFNHSSIPPSHTFQSQMNHQTSTVPQVIPQVAYQSPQAPTQLMTESPFGTYVLSVPFSPGDDPIACLNKAMAFLTAVASSRFPSTNNQLRTSSNPRNQATIQDGRVTVQQVQGRQGQNYSGTTYKGNATSSRGNTTSGQARVVKCYNCQGEGHMARQCTQPKRPRNAAWYKEKAMLAEAQEAGQILDEEQLVFLTDLGILADQVQTIIPHNAAFQTGDLDTYDSDCNDLSTAQVVIMANISNYGSDIILE